MRFETPLFWYDTEPGTRAKLLAPLASCYAYGAALHARISTPGRVSIPVICVGNVNAGGSGKTPIAMLLMRMLQDSSLFHNPCFLSRGYGGRIMGPSAFDQGRHDVRDVGDEVMLLGKVAPTIVAKNRLKGAEHAISTGHDVIIMDDGLQNYHLAKDLQMVVIDGSMGFGNGQVLPAGPLREDLETGLQKADLFILIGDDECDIVRQLPDDKPLIHARVSARVPETHKGQRFLAFAGLGWPEKFFSALRKGGIDIAEAVSFPDHHPYSPRDMDDLLQRAENMDARLITTRKDFMRVPSFYAENKKVVVAGMDVTWAEPDTAYATLESLFQKMSTSP